MNLARFDLVTLSLFVAVARHGSISAGARQSHLAIAAASKRISDLEAAIGTALLYRHASGVELTEAGQTCFRHALGILQDVERMAGVMSDYASGVRGQVRMWANTSAITQFLPDDLATFMQLHPTIRIELEEQNSSDIVAAIVENRADVGIFADRTPALSLTTFVYREDELVVVTPHGHPLAERGAVRYADTLEYDFVSLPPATSLAARLLEESSRIDRTFRLRIQVRSFDAMCRMVMARLGVGILPRIAAEPHVKSMHLALVPLEDVWARRSLLIGMRDPNALAVSARLLVTHLCGDAVPF
jgi:DNA-binding transcriptional LysR family regulator